MTDRSERVVVTGATGYIGRALTAALAARGQTPVCTDQVEPNASEKASCTRFVAGDLSDETVQKRLFEEPVHALVHLASVVSGAAESDYALGLRANLHSTLDLLERCRLQQVQGGPKVRLVFASSIAVFGVPVPPRIDDATEPHPTLSYGAQKRACEVLIGDAHRRGFIDARVLRLAGVVIRPPAANGALSGFNSDLFREPLAGRIYRCPVGADATLWISSLAKTVGNLLRVLDLPREALGAHAVINAPALCVSVQEILAALKRFDPAAAARVQLPAQPEAALSAQFGRWPRDCAFDRAMHLGLTADASLAAIIEDHLATRQIQQ